MMPTAVSEDLGLFDRFASVASGLVSRAPFFALCVLLVVLWLPSYFFIGDVDTWQLIINTMTTIVTFLLVALLQNSSYRADQALQHKLNSIADALADLMCKSELDHDVTELKAAVGLEDRESSD